MLDSLPDPDDVANHPDLTDLGTSTFVPLNLLFRALAAGREHADSYAARKYDLRRAGERVTDIAVEIAREAIEAATMLLAGWAFGDDTTEAAR